MDGIRAAARALSLWLPVGAWCGLIFFLSGIPNLQTELGPWDFVLRKCAHMTEYAILYFLLYRALRGSIPSVSARRLSFLSLLITIFYAVSDEYHQSFVPTRGPSAIDVGIDSSGALVALLIHWYIRVRKAAHHENP